ncbi:hypothetical protein Q5692_04085 [Microcoleus sp. C2C3]|uniref:hypothetical protein n=1 Tax=unclassified Microcoleus TaxID=2642155 RepID=UPI002FD2E1C0
MHHHNQSQSYSRRQKAEGRRKKEEGRRKKEEARRKNEEAVTIARVSLIKNFLIVLAVAIG